MCSAHSPPSPILPNREKFSPSEWYRPKDALDMVNNQEFIFGHPMEFVDANPFLHPMIREAGTFGLSIFRRRFGHTGYL